MNQLFTDNIQEIATVFDVSIHTLKKWRLSESRVAHCDLLSTGLTCLKEGDSFYDELISSDALLPEIAISLGFQDMFKLSIGIPSITMRKWAQREGNRKLLIGVLIGHHWKVIQGAANDFGLKSPIQLTKNLKKIDVPLNEFVSLFLFSPKLVSNLIVNSKCVLSGKA